ncbi:MAG: DUF2066 domain-containing protein [Rhizobiaceae bacterium]|nr:DUF2066 domain-containing protein [Rhizobiaceae bacterium]
MALGLHRMGYARGSSRARYAVLAVAFAPLAAGAAVSSDAELFSATVIVTGRDNLAERSRGVAEALPLALTRLTADPLVAETAAARGLLSDTGAYVDDLVYRDRKQGIQISDEQGTRERSFEMTVRFDVARVEALLAQLDAKAWTGERPQIAVSLRITDSRGDYQLAAGSERGYGQRLAIEAEARALALPVTLVAEAPQQGVVLAGAMKITPAGYWNTEWRLTGSGLDEVYAFSDTTFDDAIGGALRRSAKTLAKR